MSPRMTAIASASAVLICASSAMAHDSDEVAATTRTEVTPPKAAASPQDDEAPPKWALVAGASLYNLGTAGLFPYLSGGVERRLGDRFYAMGNLGGGAGRSRAEYSGGLQESDGWWLMGELGIRHVVTDRQPIELSWFAVFHADYGRGSYVANGEYRNYGVGGKAGFVLDKHFNEWFALRLRVDMLEVLYNESDSYDPSFGLDESSSFNAYVSLTPTFAGRFAF